MKNNQQQDVFSVLSDLQEKNKEEKQQTAKIIMSSMNEKDRNDFQTILNDKNKIAEILNSPAVQQLIKKINGQHK